MSHAGRALIVLIWFVLSACSSFAKPAPTATSTVVPTPTADPTRTPTLFPSPTHTAAPTWTPTSAPISTPTPLPTKVPSPRTEGVWAALWPEPPPRPYQSAAARASAPVLVPNALRQFWVTNASTMERRELTGRLRVQGEYVQMWVEEGRWYDIRRLQQAAVVFEADIYPRVRAAVGAEWAPGVDNDPRILILHAAGLGEDVAGYTSGIDRFPRTEEPYSNEAELIVVSDGLDVDSPAYYGLLARQFAHMIHWTHDRNESHWLKQGVGDLAARLSGFGSDGALLAYLAGPDVALAAESPAGISLAQRGGAELLVAYYNERFGDEGLRALVAQPLNGIAGFEAALAGLTRVRFDEFFADWLAANYLDGERGAVPLHRYGGLRIGRPALAAEIETTPVILDMTVHPFGADYVLVRGREDLEVSFRGVTRTLMLDIPPRDGNGSYWWSNRADESLSTLTRSVDLSGADQATLGYWAWYDIELGYDYATVEVSQDQGQHWENVAASGMKAGALAASSPRWVYTGSSGSPPAWVYETVDLSPYAGEQSVTIRFTYVTDGAVTGRGFVLDGLELVDLGTAGDASWNDGDWQAEGFLRTDGLVPQYYLAVLIGKGDRVTVERLRMGEDQSATWLLPLASKSWREAVLVISGMAPMTAQPASYSLQIGPAGAGG